MCVICGSGLCNGLWRGGNESNVRNMGMTVVNSREKHSHMLEITIPIPIFAVVATFHGGKQTSLSALFIGKLRRNKAKRE